ncbi:hypothetical protein QBC45DRAFT_408419 [Copromyces sp. CBS 386.78]|nr:hypothetical protein QBC45DRAFT_408419 [Copromyces sp. CBS 386.78]
MNITCHSSFDTNLRIRVSTPTGAKDVETTSSSSRSSRPTPSYQRESHYQHQYQHAQQHQQQPMPAFMAFDGHSQSFVPEDPNHFPGAGYPTSTTISGPSTSYAQAPAATCANFGMAASSSTTGIPDMSQFQYQQQYPDAAAWEYDYPYDPNDPNNLGYDYDASLDVSSMQAPLPGDSQHGGHQDASAWYGYPAQGGSNQQQNWR